MAWNKDLPADDALLINFPTACRANWDAVELGTDANLLITNAKISTTAGIVDTKLAQITTAGKVSGAALTNLAGIPGGAGDIPLANIPTDLPDKSADTLDGEEGAYYRNADKVDGLDAADFYNYGLLYCFTRGGTSSLSYETTVYGKVELSGEETTLQIRLWLYKSATVTAVYARVKIGAATSGEVSHNSATPTEKSTTIDVSALSGAQDIKLEMKLTGTPGTGTCAGGSIIRV